MALTQARRFRKRLIPETHRCLLGLERVVNGLSFLRFVQGINHSVNVPIYFRALVTLKVEGTRARINVIKFIDRQVDTNRVTHIIICRRSPIVSRKKSSSADHTH